MPSSQSRFVPFAIFFTNIAALLTFFPATQYNDGDQRASAVEAAKMISIWCMLAAGATMGTVALLAFLWGVKSGAFEDAEDAKYIVFRDEEDD